MASNVIGLEPPLGLQLRQGVKWLRWFLGFDRDPLKWMAGEEADTLRYLSRLEHLRRPSPYEGEVVSGPNPCFFLRTFSGRREVYSADTTTQEIIPMAFFAVYNGQREYHPDVEIGTPKQY